MKDISKATTAYNEIRKRILSNQVIAGARLREDERAKKLDVNRAAIREALTRLLGEQLVVPGEKGGYFVKSFSEENVTESRELRDRQNNPRATGRAFEDLRRVHLRST